MSSCLLRFMQNGLFYVLLDDYWMMDKNSLKFRKCNSRIFRGTFKFTSVKKSKTVQRKTEPALYTFLHNVIFKKQHSKPMQNLINQREISPLTLKFLFMILKLITLLYRTLFDPFTNTSIYCYIQGPKDGIIIHISYPDIWVSTNQDVGITPQQSIQPEVWQGYILKWGCKAG